MVETDETFYWKGDYFSLAKLYGGKIGFNERGAFIIDGFTTEPAERRGTLFSAMPISSKDYRAERPTKVSYEREKGRLNIYCDWGRLHYVEASAKILDALVAELEAQDVRNLKVEATV